jgi:putative oxidoreductase
MTSVIREPSELTADELRRLESVEERQRVRPTYVSRSVLLLRVLVGLLFIGHGSQKLFGWFGGPGMAGWTDSIQKAGLQPVQLWATLGVAGELVGGALLLLGFLTPIAAALLIGDMAVAIVKVAGGRGFWSQNGGFEYNLVLIVLSLAIGLMGPGVYSLDRRLPWALPRPWIFIAALVVVGIGVAIALLT